ISNADDAMAVMRRGADGLVHMWRDRQLTDEELTEFASSGTFVIPTLSVIELVTAYYKDQQIDRAILSREQLLSELKRVYDAGIMLLTGTDPPNFGLDYGESLHHEIGLFAESGIPVVDVLKSATVYPHEAYDRPAMVIEEGMPATFFLAAGDPRTDIANTRRISMRWKRGAFIEESKEY
ncbi:MAG: amidohydrolase, partial [Bacteroidota bacterium]